MSPGLVDVHLAQESEHGQQTQGTYLFDRTLHFYRLLAVFVLSFIIVGRWWTRKQSPWIFWTLFDVFRLAPQKGLILP